MRWLLCLLVAALPGPACVCSQVSAGSKPLQIGMAKTFFTEKSKGAVEVVMDDFKEAMKETTGLDGELLTRFGPSEVAEKLHKKQLDIVILHAVEFAWVQKKYPDLQPLMIAVGKNPDERAYLVVHKDSTAKTLADLQGKTFDLPLGSKEHCRLYLEKTCMDIAQKGPATFFSSIKKSDTQEEALNDVARNKAQATIVDSQGLMFYKEIRGPVFEKNLKILQESNPFPPAVIIYKPGAIDEQTLAKFTTGLMKAHNTRAGQDVMKLWKLRAFEPIPKNYTAGLTELLKLYPAPSAP